MHVMATCTCACKCICVCYQGWSGRRDQACAWRVFFDHRPSCYPLQCLMPPWLRGGCYKWVLPPLCGALQHLRTVGVLCGRMYSAAVGSSSFHVRVPLLTGFCVTLCHFVSRLCAMFASQLCCCAQPLLNHRSTNTSCWVTLPQHLPVSTVTLCSTWYSTAQHVW